MSSSRLRGLLADHHQQLVNPPELADFANRIKLEPIVLGTGKALFKDVTGRIRQTLRKAKSSYSIVVGLYYQVNRANVHS
ncbi:hypothetical protein [Spirosoma sp.]|uniref:hypothetical protein n=1 Tax=Spirosoma sp. TaxID=1899569 RepID=UPI00262BFDA9|nr:hypothetical protein [Spirosoma sp.]MCX6216930.1 hypothetical protein [Spirosoma sp.]